jgi:hypothetical protein
VSAKPEIGIEQLIQWSPVTCRAWDADPDAYVRAGAVGWGRSRRLGKLVDVERHFKAYVGIQHFDPDRWHLPGEPRAKVFLSLFLQGRTVALHTYPTMAEALEALRAFYRQLPLATDVSPVREAAEQDGSSSS